MKLLRGQVETVIDGDYTVTVSVVTTSKQAQLMDLALIKGAEGRISCINYMLRNCIDSVSIGDESFDPIDISEKADISDQETLKSILKIGEMAESVIFLSEEERKK